MLLCFFMLFVLTSFKSLLGFVRILRLPRKYNLCKMRSSVSLIMTGVTHGGKRKKNLIPDGINTLIIKVVRLPDGRAMTTGTHLSNNRILVDR